VGATKLIAEVRITLFKLAVTVAVWALVIVPAVTVNVLLLAPLPMETLPGDVSCALLLDSVTVVVPDDALSKVTVQVDDWLLLSEPGVQLNVERAAGTGAVSVKPALCDPPFKEAVTCGVSLAVTAATFAVNDVLL
jgi:hypothetical protein